MDTTIIQRIQTKFKSVILKTNSNAKIEKVEEFKENEVSQGRFQIFKGLVSNLFAGKSDNPMDNVAFNANILHQQFIQQRDRVMSAPDRERVLSVEPTPEKRQSKLLDALGFGGLNIFKKMLQNTLTPHPQAHRFFDTLETEDLEERERQEEIDDKNTYLKLKTDIIRDSKTLINIKPKTTGAINDENGTCESQLVRSAGL